MNTKDEKGQKAKMSEDEKVEVVKDKLVAMSEDLSLMLRDGHSITTVKGMKFRVPALGGRAEKEAIKLIVGYLREHSEIIKKLFGDKADKKEGGSDFNIESIISFVIDLADDGYDVIQKIAGAIIRKDVEWVDEHLLLADLIAIITPFIRAEVKPIVQAFKQNVTLGNLGEKVKKIMGEAKEASSTE